MVPTSKSALRRTLSLRERSAGSSSRRRSLDVLEPRAVVRVGVALAHRVLEVPRLALVGPVVGEEAVRLAPVRDRGRVVAVAVQVLTELELGGRGGLGVGARLRARDHLVGRVRVRGSPRRARPSRAASRRRARVRCGSSALRAARRRSRAAPSSGRCCGTIRSSG